MPTNKTALRAKYPEWQYYGCRDNVVKNIDNIRTEEVNEKFIPQYTTSHELHAKFEVSRYCGY